MLLRAGFLAARLLLDVCGFRRPVLARGWHGVRGSHGSEDRSPAAGPVETVSRIWVPGDT
jgi:hypothetical protein